MTILMMLTTKMIAFNTRIIPTKVQYTLKVISEKAMSKFDG